MAKTDLTAELLREFLHYDPETGVFTRRIASGYRGCHRAGSIVGSISKDGYIEIGLEGRGFMAQRLAWLYVHGQWPVHQIDHRNGIRDDNRISNLRDVVPYVNAQNKRKPQRGTTSGFIGVGKNGNGWTASICARGQRHYLGYFDDPSKAAMVYLGAKRRLHEGNTL